MESFLPREVQAGLDAARKAASKQASRLRIKAGDATFPVLRAWQGGFALAPDAAPALRGRVEFYDGSRLLSHCLIVASEQEGGELRFEYKRMTDVHDTQPLDFYRAPDAPIALLDRPRNRTPDH